jgi:hypothetical protein
LAVAVVRFPAKAARLPATRAASLAALWAVAAWAAALVADWVKAVLVVRRPAAILVRRVKAQVQAPAELAAAASVPAVTLPRAARTVAATRVIRPMPALMPAKVVRAATIQATLATWECDAAIRLRTA